MTTLAEPEWDADTRSLVLGHALVPRCASCGGDPAECQDAALGESWVVPDPVRCHRTTALGERQAAVDPKDSPIPAALLWSVHLRREAVT